MAPCGPTAREFAQTRSAGHHPRRRKRRSAASVHRRGIHRQIVHGSTAPESLAVPAPESTGRTMRRELRSS